MTLIAKARSHLRNNKQTYREHFVFAGGHGLRCLRAAAYLLIHSVLPCFFERAGSRLVERMEKDFVDHRSND
jgi:hypothetical protein